MTTKVFITVDTEFSIGGAFQNPSQKKPVGTPMVMCVKNGKSHGLGFILDTLKKNDIKATFFVEALNVNFFGYDAMGEIAHLIYSQDQDIQLHLHPVWTYFKNPEWQTQLTINPPNDDFRLRKQQEIESLLTEGTDIFLKWGLQKPIAIRTGSLWVNTSVYKAMRSTGIKYSSNVGVGIYRPKDEELQLYSGIHEIESCFELPVLSYRGVDIFSYQHIKTLTITGSSWREIKHLLQLALKKNIDCVVILTHPSEFVKNQNDQYTNFIGNRINQKRFNLLCEFLSENRDKFSVQTFSDLSTIKEPNQNSANTLLSVPIRQTVNRVVQNYMNDHIRCY